MKTWILYKAWLAQMEKQYGPMIYAQPIKQEVSR